ncbi:MATE family efflux transporter [Pseudenhygromyxa sp. WMMC2535]|uniref:MATE family efflux transporter n=1 Tax=Pseudenhygromyxa sp. WMMC2535 TaxID=2712867 RepID=UPI001555DDA2|nr:MATE family efflux transporter [Pseudenhygromyxa sp. WMMC2535]NVB38546.1 MATE family efflux transporter [Pseudenhygromyxa sp. WMMC2535]
MSGDGKRSRLRTLLVLAWPVVLSRSAQAVIGFCDALMTAPLGEDAVAASTTGSLNTFTMLILPMGVVFIVQSFAAQYGSKGDLASARRYGWYGLILAAVAGLFAAAVIPLVELALSPMAYSANVKALMGDYIEIRLLSVMAVVGFEAIGNWYGGLGNTRIQMIGSLVMMVLNVALNALLIQGRLGLPALGVSGAAWASVFSTWVAFALVAALFVRGWGSALATDASAAHEPAPNIEPAPERPLPAPELGLDPRKLRPSEFVRMLRFGLPSGLNWFMEFAAFLFFIDVVVAKIGTTTLAALMIVFQVNSVSFMPSFGLSSSGAILAGQAVGRDEHDEVPGILRMTMATAALWQGCVGLLYLAFPAVIMAWFTPAGQDTSALVSVGAPLLALSAVWQLFDAAGISLNETLRAAGDTLWTMWARLGLAWALFVPTSYLAVGHFEGGGLAAIACLATYLAALAGVLALRFRAGAWRSIQMTE